MRAIHVNIADRGWKRSHLMLYGIIVRTPFGRFNGKMDLEINEGKVSGTLSFMDFSSEFHGEGDMDGFSFSGSFDIPIGSLDYKEAALKAP